MPISIRTIELAIAVVVILISAEVLNACTCISSYAPRIAEYSESNAVFVGKVQSVTKIRKSERAILGDGVDRIVTFRIEKNYKGIEPSTKLISLFADYNSTSCSFAVDDRNGPRVGETWIVFAYRFQDKHNMSFGGSCNSSNKLQSRNGPKEIEREIFKFREKQGILGSVVIDFTKLSREAEAVLIGEGIERTARVDSEGYFWFPLEKAGNYRVTIKVPFVTTLIDAAKFPDTVEKTISSTSFSYNVVLGENDFNYNELNVNKP